MIGFYLQIWDWWTGQKVCRNAPERRSETSLAGGTGFGWIWMQFAETIDLSVPLRFGQNLEFRTKGSQNSRLWIKRTISERKGQKKGVNKISSVPGQGYSKMPDLRTEKTEKISLTPVRHLKFYTFCPADEWCTSQNLRHCRQLFKYC